MYSKKEGKERKKQEGEKAGIGIGNFKLPDQTNDFVCK